eukprot:170928-Pyramimonas_sp.AAC.1
MAKNQRFFHAVSSSARGSPLSNPLSLRKTRTSLISWNPFGSASWVTSHVDRTARDTPSRPASTGLGTLMNSHAPVS